jgi:transcriptional regulator of acetoin/glycerol metabolism
MEDVVSRAAKLVNAQMSLLIHGETGTGKEYLAKALHAAGARAAKPFIPVNCAALPESLIEAELFGYEPGAFTGATAKGKKGLVIEADGGTLFLDEIGDMPLASQTRLLRVLAEREVTPVGRTKPVPVNIRVIAATHRDLVAEVKAGRFRDDLYFRLNGAVLTLPALRQRRDLEWLVARLLQTRMTPAGRIGGEPLRLAPAARDAIRAYAWPGNIRELVNALDYACAVAGGGRIELEDLPDAIRRPALADGWPSLTPLLPVPAPSFGQAPPDQAMHLARTLAAHHWNVSRTARELGVDRTTVHRQMRRFGIVAPQHREPGASFAP